MFSSNKIKEVIAIVSFIEISFSLTSIAGIEFKSQRSTINARVISSIFFVLLLACSIIFSFFQTSEAMYIITSGLIFITYLLLALKIIND